MATETHKINNTRYGMSLIGHALAFAKQDNFLVEDISSRGFTWNNEIMDSDVFIENIEPYFFIERALDDAILGE